LKTRSQSFLFISLFAFLFFVYNNCHSVSFDQGASVVRDLRSQDIIVGNPLTSTSKTILNEICQVITRCHSQVSLIQCENGVLGTGGIDYQLGLQANSVATYSDIVQAESQGSLQGNPTATKSCLSDINTLNCGDSRVQGAFDPMLSNPFSRVSSMMPTAPGSCPAVFNQPVNRKEYFVATTGSDLNDGSMASPWATISHASQALVPGPDGAIVHVASGIYNPTVTGSCSLDGFSCGIKTARSGTSVAPLVYISDQQGGAKIKATGAYSSWHNSGNFVQIIGFEIIGESTTSIGIHSEGSFVQVIGNHIHHIPATAACAANQGSGGIAHSNPASHDNDSIGNTIHDIGPFPGNGLDATAYCNHAHGITHEQPRGRIQNNLIYRVGAWGIHSWSTASQLNITNNLIFDSGARDRTGTLLGGGLVLAAEPTAPLHDSTTVANNIFRNNSGTGIWDNGHTGNNNIFANNLFFSNGQDSSLKSVPAIGSISADPLMVDFKLDGSGDYRLRPTSPAINSGTANCAPGKSSCMPAFDHLGFARSLGGNIDIGPFEWHP
jgi:hypothetical protein